MPHHTYLIQNLRGEVGKVYSTGRAYDHGTTMIRAECLDSHVLVLLGILKPHTTICTKTVKYVQKWFV